MKTTYLFPHRFKTIGLILLIPSLILGSIYLIDSEWLPEIQLTTFALYGDEFLGEDVFLQFFETNMTDEILGLILILGGMFAAFSREKQEDEFVMQLRLGALLWATYFNYIVLALSILFIFGTPFWQIMVANMFTILLVFIIRFNWMLQKSKKATDYEE